MVHERHARRALLSRLLGQAFELLYGPLAPWYDVVSSVGFAGEWRRWQREVLCFVEDGPVLELGAGTGDLLPHLAAAGLRPVGLERSATMLAQARRKLAARRLVGVVVRGDARALPFADAYFGAVVATFPSNYLLAPATWREIERVLRPGGRVVVALAGTLSPDSPGRWLRAAAYRVLYGPDSAHLALPDTGGLHVREVVTATRHGRLRLLVASKPATGSPG